MSCLPNTALEPKMVRKKNKPQDGDGGLEQIPLTSETVCVLDSVFCPWMLKAIVEFLSPLPTFAPRPGLISSWTSCLSSPSVTLLISH